MSIATILDGSRRRYVDFFSAAAANLRTQADHVATELLISINNESLAYPYRYLRADAVTKGSDGQPQLFQFASDPDPDFQSALFNFGAFQVELHPFTWDDVQIVFDRAPSNLAQLENWITRWLDVDDGGAHRTGDLDGAVHSFTPVETNGDWWFLTADFGTAPTDAMIECIELLAGQGMTHIVLKAG